MACDEKKLALDKFWVFTWKADWAADFLRKQRPDQSEGEGSDEITAARRGRGAVERRPQQCLFAL
jgi:hypothetical protein